MRELLIEQLRHIMNALPDGMTFEQWYTGEMCSFEAFEIGDDTHREAVSYALGYLRGAHEALDVTLWELLDEHGIDADQCGDRDKRRSRSCSPAVRGRYYVSRSDEGGTLVDSDGKLVDHTWDVIDRETGHSVQNTDTRAAARQRARELNGGAS